MAKHLLPTAILLTVAAPGLAQAPAPMSKATFIQRIDRDFSAADANKDGFVDRSELEAQQAKTMRCRIIEYHDDWCGIAICIATNRSRNYREVSPGLRRRDADQHLEIVQHLDRRLPFRERHRGLRHGHVVQIGRASCRERV